MNETKILVAGHDWGGLNLLAPLLRAWGADTRFVVHFVGSPTVRRDLAYLVQGLTLAPAGADLSDWAAHRQVELDATLEQILQEGAYDVVLCSTSAHAILERRLLARAQSAGIASIAFCDMWWAYSERFFDGTSWALPDRLWVIDEPMRAAAANIAWPRPLPIDVVGSPLFADLAQRRTEQGEVCGRAIRFISEPVSVKFPEAGIDEFALAEMLVTAVQAIGSGTPVVIRPHPVESAEAWRRWCFARRHLNVAFDTLPLSEAIADSTMAVGISSILLTEMRLCGVPAAALRPPEADPTYYCLPFDDLEIAVLPDMARLVDWLQAPHVARPPAAALEHAGSIERATALVLALAHAGAGKRGRRE